MNKEKLKRLNDSHNWQLREVEGVMGTCEWVCDSCEMNNDEFYRDPQKCSSYRRFLAPLRNFMIAFHRKRIAVLTVLRA